MRVFSSRSLLLCLLFLGLTVTACPAGAEAFNLWPWGAQKHRLSYVQLRSMLMDFADRYIQIIGQAADTLQKETHDPNTQVAIHSMKLFPCSAAFTIAIDPSPHVALLDMEVLVHLQGSVWKETAPKRFGDRASVVLDAQQTLEKDIDAIALKVLRPEQLEELKTLVEDWRKENPGQRYVSYIRLSDFTKMNQRRHKKTSVLSVSGLLATLQIVNLDETTRSVDQARMVAERTLYLTQRMPTLLRWQSEMLFYETAATPEMKDLAATIEAMKGLPALLASERKTTIEQVSHAADDRTRHILREVMRTAILIALVVFGLALLYRIFAKLLDRWH